MKSYPYSTCYDTILDYPLCPDITPNAFYFTIPFTRPFLLQNVAHLR